MKKQDNKQHRQIIFLNSVMLDDPNRGCQALTYGSISFISNYLKSDEFSVISPSYFLRRKRPDVVYDVPLNNKIIRITKRHYWLPLIILDLCIFKITGIQSSISRFRKDLKSTQYTFSISGGDGFSDIYSYSTFIEVNRFTFFFTQFRKKVIILPQTIGPFYGEKTRKTADKILHNADQIFVRDLSFAKELDRKNLHYVLDHDVSKYMLPKKINITLPNNAIGINISGLLYFNNFRNLTGRSLLYKKLIMQLIEKFQELNLQIVLIPHTYNYSQPVDFDDDLSAIKDIISTMSNKRNITMIDGDYSAAELKYIISKCDYFIGSRMHANFAAIYTNIPVFGLAYSYKFDGAFKRFALEEHNAIVIDIEEEDIDIIINQIMLCYQKRHNTKQSMMILNE